MRLTAEEEICKEYSARDKDGFVHCNDCPLAIDKKSALCKRTITKQEWDARCEDGNMVEKRGCNTVLPQRSIGK